MKNATIEKMKTMRLLGMIKIYQNLYENSTFSDMTVDEVLAGMIDAEWDERYNRKLTRLLKQAQLRYQASIEQINYDKKRKIDKNLLLRLSSCDWIREAKNIIITGKTGVGKSYLTCALGHQACINNYTVRYFNCLKIFNDLKFAKADGTYNKKLNRIKKTNLIILDDFGMKVMDAESRLILLELLEDRYENGALIISTQLPVDKWFDIIGDNTIADAVCDRIIHRAYSINIKGDSMRKFNNNSGNKRPQLVL